MGAEWIDFCARAQRLVASDADGAVDAGTNTTASFGGSGNSGSGSGSGIDALRDAHTAYLDACARHALLLPRRSPQVHCQFHTQYSTR